MPALATDNTANESSAPVLNFESVSVHAKDDGDGFDLTLNSGELAIFEIASGDSIPDIAGLATGREEPAKGGVKFCGTSWKDLDEVAASRQRISIGQVFQSTHCAHWISNLDIDENVYLAEQMSGRDTPTEIISEAKILAQSFGLKEIPKSRESKVPRDRLMQSQWVRAFLPKPLKLLILERPSYKMAPDAVALLLEQVAKSRSQGTAVLWITPSLNTAEQDSLKPTHHFQPTPRALIPANG